MFSPAQVCLFCYLGENLLVHVLNHCPLSCKSVCLPHCSPLLQPTLASLNALAAIPLSQNRLSRPHLPHPLCQLGPEGAWPPIGDPLGAGGAGWGGGDKGGGGGEIAERKTMAGQIASWPRRAIIYCNSGPVRLKEREGEVAWRALPLIRLLPPTPPITHNGWLSGGW